MMVRELKNPECYVLKKLDVKGNTFTLGSLVMHVQLKCKGKEHCAQQKKKTVVGRWHSTKVHAKT